MRRTIIVGTLALLTATTMVACVSGSRIRSQSEVLRADLERARRSGAMKCAPRELALAEAHLDFAEGELGQGDSFRAAEHIGLAEAASEKALDLSKECGPRQVLVRQQEDEPSVIVKIEETDLDGDGILDKDDQCPDRPEDKDNFQDGDGCPDPDNDGDGVLDGNDLCPDSPGPLSNQGCPEEEPEDKDADGVLDDVDQCPGQPEDKDGFQDEDGCPELDNDGDGILDTSDGCPDEAGPLENRGCPVLDRDGDGISDDADQCPDEPEDKDGFRDDDGCPDLDNDGDQIPDRNDRCPDVAGPVENFGCPIKDADNDGVPDDQDACPTEPGTASEKGCPVRDSDGDGVLDPDDKCPNEAGPKENGGCPDADKDNDGVVDRLDRCPDEYGTGAEQGCPKKYNMVVVKEDRIELKQQINFASGKSAIRGRQSHQIIEEVAQALDDNPQIKRIRVEGHTDSVGSDAFNLRLSQERADSVKAALIKEGIDPARLQAVGFGETRPIASNSSASGRAANRRTEFNVVRD